MLQLDYTNPQPLYEQIREKIKEMIFRGLLPTHQQLPSVREMAAMLALNPNTIQKAYRDLELQGYLYSVRGKGNFVAAPTQEHRAGQAEALLREMAQPIKKLRFFGITLETVLERAAQAYEEKAPPGQDGPAKFGQGNPLGASGPDAEAAVLLSQNHYEGGKP
jgi:GntR family transcriptional regulator